MVFENLQKRLAIFQALMSVSKTDVGSRMRAAHGGLCWYWVHWHATHELSEARGRLSELVERAITSLPPREKDDLRPQLDSLLIQLAALVADAKLAVKVCEMVVTARPGVSSYQHLEAWNGVLKWTILNDREKAEEQFDVMQRHSPLQTFEWAPHPLIDAFLKGDWKKFRKAYEARSDTHHKAAEKEGALRRDGKGETIDVKQKHMNFLWPWPAAVFGRFALRAGAQLDFDSPWLPRAFLT